MKTEKRRFYLIGDSITRGHLSGGVGQNAPLVHAFRRAAFHSWNALPEGDIYNVAFNGATTSDWAGARIDDLLASIPVSACYFLICLGVNDAKIGRSVGEFEFHYRNLVNKIANAGQFPYLSVAPFVQPGSPPWPDDAFKTIAAYNKRLYNLVVDTGVLLDEDAYTHFQQCPYEQVDGVHPNTRGAIWLGNQWGKALNE